MKFEKILGFFCIFSYLFFLFFAVNNTKIFVIYLLSIIILIWMYYTYSLGAPFIPSSLNSIDKMLELAELKNNEKLYDLGSGDGRILIRAVKKYNVKGIGVEVDGLRVIISKIMIFLSGKNKNIRIIRKNFFHVNLRDADIIVAYLLPKTLEKLKCKFRKELKRGTKIITNRFQIKQWKPVKIDKKLKIYVYRME